MEKVFVEHWYDFLNGYIEIEPDECSKRSKAIPKELWDKYKKSLDIYIALCDEIASYGK
jgi:hypothetical protein